MALISNRARLYDGGKSSGANQTATYRGSYWATNHVDGTANKWTADGTHLTQYAHRFVASQLNLAQLGIYL